MTAAAAPVADPSKLLTASMGRRTEWQDEAWRFTRCIGELGYFVRWRSNACAQVRLIASEVDPDTGLPTGSIDPENAEGQQFIELVKQIAGGPLGQKALIKRAAVCLTVPGELTICILQRPEGEKWFAVSQKQITASTKGADSVAIKLPDGTVHDFDKSKDAMFRVWNEDPEDPTQADSPVRACLDPLGEIERATKKIRNADQSRLLNNGLLMVPSEASLPDTQSPQAADQPGPSSPMVQRKVAGSLQRMIVQAAEHSDRNENSLAALVPIVVAAPGDHLGKVTHIEFSKEATKTAVDIRTDAISRLARGLDVSPERLLGMGASTNHWTSYLLADEDVKLHITPVMEVLCQAFYTCTLANMLEKMGINSTNYVLWFDTSQLTKDPDLTDEAKDTYDHGITRSESFVKTMGLSADSMYDFTSEDGWAEWARDRVSDDPARLPLLAQLIPELAEYDFTQAAAPPQYDDYGNPIDTSTTSSYDQNTDQPTTDQQNPINPGQEPDTENNTPTTPTYALTNAALAAEDLAVNRALELAAGRRIPTTDRALHAQLRNIPKHERNRYLPAVSPDKLTQYIKGWDDTLTPEYAARHNVNLALLKTAVLRRVTNELTTGQVNGHATNAPTGTPTPLRRIGGA